MANPVSQYQQNFPVIGLKFVDASDQIATPWYLLLRALWNRTGMGPGVPTVAGAAYTDAGASAATATPLATTLAFVTGAGAGVLLPSLAANQSCTVVNVGAGALSVYPPAGAQIDALGVAAYPLAAGKSQVFTFQTTVQIYSLQLG